MADDEVNDGHYHEAMHATHMLASTWEDFICDAPAVRSNPALKAEADRICLEMNGLYQQIGAAAPE